MLNIIKSVEMTLFFPPAYSSEDQLLWRPDVLPVQEVEKFLLNTQRPRGREGAACTVMHGDTVRDNEQVRSLDISSHRTLSAVLSVFPAVLQLTGYV